MTEQLWDTAERVGTALGETPKMANFVRAFDTGAPGDLSQRISQFTATFSPLRIHQVLLGIRMNGMEETAAFIRSPADEQWLSDAVDCGTAFLVFIEYLRSRLPGYPVMRVPHLRPGSPHLMNNPYTVEGFPWDPEIRALRLQLSPAPDTSPLGGADYGHLLESLVAALTQHPTWLEFAEARTALSSHDRTMLSDIAARFAKSVTEERIDQEAGDRALTTQQYRVATLAAACDEATGAASRYLAAFTSVNELIDIVAAFIDTVITAGRVFSVEPTRAALRGPGLVRQAAITVRGDNPMHNPGEVLFVEGGLPGATGVLYPTSIAHKWGRLNDPDSSRMTLSGTLVTAAP